eukprot:g3164.t1
MRRILLQCAWLLGVTFVAAAQQGATTSADVVVFGATGAGCVAAIAASRAGAARVVLLAADRHIGGMLTGGLMHTDSANASVIQGLTREVFERCERQYPGRPTNASYPPGHSPPGWLFESHVMLEVVEAMLAEAGVEVVRSVGGITHVLRGSGSDSSSIEALVVAGAAASTFKASVFIDASYEGDLAAAANCSMTVGREATTQYGELHAGRQPGASIGAKVSPYWNASLPAPQVSDPANVIPHVAAAVPAAVGDADRWVEPFDFRLCFTDSPSHRIDFTRPPGYDPREFELWRRIYRLQPPRTLAQAGLSCLGPIPNNYTDCGSSSPCRKCDMLGMNHGTDDTNGSWDYAEASAAERASIFRDHVRFTQGLLWFWATDPAVPSSVRAEMASWGHCNDEYFADSDPPHWPPQLYVREGRRLVGSWVWTEHTLDHEERSRTVGLGSYGFDSHYVSRVIHRTGDPRQDYVVKEGRVDVDREQPLSGQDDDDDDDDDNRRVTAGCGVCMNAPFRMPYDAMLPKESEASNLLVPVAVSASHVRFNAIRMEPTWMILGESAGTAAAMSLSSSSPSPSKGRVHEVDVVRLQRRLAAQGQKIEP